MSEIEIENIIGRYNELLNKRNIAIISNDVELIANIDKKLIVITELAKQYNIELPQQTQLSKR